ncbi:MAG: heavy metal-binding domain-containing protein [Defluviitaleaceae bacterium]|nr:heavy metal-binding domain-containing protein [Defluviitaleaceae bacterium]
MKSNNELNEMIGNNVYKLRVSHNMSIKELAELMTYSESALRSVETGARGASACTLFKIAEIFDITLDELMHKSVDEASSEYQIKLKEIIMLIVTTPILDGKSIKKYHGTVFSQVVAGFGIGRSVFGSLRSLAGGRSESHEELVVSIREQAIQDLTEKAEKLGANAIVGFSIDLEMIGSGSDGGLLKAHAMGTAVVVDSL